MNLFWRIASMLAWAALVHQARNRWLCPPTIGTFWMPCTDPLNGVVFFVRPVQHCLSERECRRSQVKLRSLESNVNWLSHSTRLGNEQCVHAVNSCCACSCINHLCCTVRAYYHGVQCVIACVPQGISSWIWPRGGCGAWSQRSRSCSCTPWCAFPLWAFRPWFVRIASWTMWWCLAWCIPGRGITAVYTHCVNLQLLTVCCHLLLFCSPNPTLFVCQVCVYLRGNRHLVIPAEWSAIVHTAMHKLCTPCAWTKCVGETVIILRIIIHTFVIICDAHTHTP